MQLWRLCQRKHLQTAFQGLGGLYAPGRWTPQGFRCVYTSESLALASLEVFVRLESDKIPLVAIRAFLAEGTTVQTIEPAMLPEDWQAVRAYPRLQAIGREWLESLRAAVLKVPSAIVPVEYNYLLNPAHPELQLRTDPPQQFRFDRRMWQPRNH
ncbi:RES family NAD+ phosphorylase [Gloeobacter morelensis]|uniref:RES family NAD+ phosphorylase n=1 Tax=Gloeobacter morelensis MG652769 TaxID=2781736 RepID=A0ABY3PJP0_9CYAN|nr:RES family NAD+ phosphorylase [Gloeobacter morelensis]UFP93768.1 RES family NAD+ phosphorylase [Gloeobacter morelensis MG652769]